MLRDEAAELSWFQEIAHNFEKVLHYRQNFAEGLMASWPMPEIPFFVLPEQFADLNNQVSGLSQILKKAAQLIVVESKTVPALWKNFQFPDCLWEWMVRCEGAQIDLGYGRPDLHYNDKVTMLESNFSAYAGARFESSCMAEYHQNHPAVLHKTFSQGISIKDPLKEFARIFEQEAAALKSQDTVICFLSNRTYQCKDGFLPYKKLILRLRKYMTSIDLFEGFIEDLIYKRDGIYLPDGRKITYSFVSSYPLHAPEQAHLYVPLWQAASEGKIIFLDSLEDLLRCHKLLFAMVQNFPDRFQLTAAEKQRVVAHLPEMLILQELPGWSEQTFRAQSLRQELISNQKKWVLKKTISAQGEAVFIGHLATELHWVNHVERALKEGGWIAQRYVYSPQRVLPYIYQKKLVPLKVHPVMSAFVMQDQVIGHSIRCYVESSNPQNSTGNINNIAIQFEGVIGVRNP